MVAPSKAKEQASRAKINAVLSEIGLAELVKKAKGGHQGSLFLLAKMADRDPKVREALLLLQPRRNSANDKRREWVSPLEQAGRLSNGKIILVQGGSPGLKKR